MTTAAEFLRLAAAGLRGDTAHLHGRRASGTLTEAERIRLEANTIAAGIVEHVAIERLAAVREECSEVVAAVANDSWNRGRLVGIGDAIRVLEVRVRVARWWWQVPSLRAALASVQRLQDHTRDNTRASRVYTQNLHVARGDDGTQQ